MKIGRVTGNSRNRSILRQIKTKRDEVINGAGPGEDCAIFSYDRRDLCGAVVTCMRSGNLPVSGIIQKGLNALAAAGAEGITASVEILLPPEAEEEQLKEIMREAENACGERKLQLAQAEAKVTPAVREAYVTVTVCGVRTRDVDALAKPGQDILISKWIALEGTAALAKKHLDELSEHYPAWLAEEAAGFDRYLSTVPEAAIAIKSGVGAMHNLSEGGIFAALWELAEGAGVGLTIDLKKIPIRQETVEVCNQLNVNPYELLSGGSLMMTAQDGEALAETLAAAGIPAAVIGKVTDSNDRLILNEDEVRYLDRPQVDGIYGK